MLRDDSEYLDELGHKFPVMLLSFYIVYVWSVDVLVEFRAQQIVYELTALVLPGTHCLILEDQVLK